MVQRRITVLTASLCAAATALAAGGCMSSDPAEVEPAPRTPASVFIAPDGADRGRCGRSAPCRTLAYAYGRARPGEVVELAAGRYEEQSIAPAGGSDRQPGRVVFRAAEGARARVDQLTIEAGVQGIEVQDVEFPDGWSVGPADEGPPATDIVFRRTKGSLFSIMNARDVSVVGGSYGPSLDSAATIKVYNPDNTYVPTDVLVSGVRFHDFTRSSDDVHTECLQVYAGLRVTIRGNRFSNCDGTGALALTTLGSTSLRDVLAENNWFDDRGDAFYAVQADLSVEDLVFRYNSSMGSMAFTGECGEGGCRPASVIANVMPWNPSLCADGVSYSHNVLKGGSCGSTDASVDRLAFAAAERFDLHLAPASPAHCMGDPASIPETDIDGEPRGRGRRPDAGADQVPAPDPLPSRCRLPGS